MSQCCAMGPQQDPLAQLSVHHTEVIPLISVETRGEQAAWGVNGKGGRRALPGAESKHPKLDPAVSHCLAASFSPACPRSCDHLTAGRVIPRCHCHPWHLHRQHGGGGGRKHGCHSAKTANSSTLCLVSPRSKPAAHMQGKDDGRSDPATGSGDRTMLMGH